MLAAATMGKVATEVQNVYAPMIKDEAVSGETLNCSERGSRPGVTMVESLHEVTRRVGQRAHDSTERVMTTYAFVIPDPNTITEKCAIFHA